ncbi:MAG TPA: SDR family NAD(P)-dependent oxidoreductase [Candidatus Acidoferrales bacterium]|nr:SDR family NAD(P)-dependent oxidoreductase [Candidatus Acidoferrales bacterium]
MPDKMKLLNRTAVVTGAASGIGRAIAISLARRGCHLALADLNETELARTAEMAASQGLRISRHRLDVSDREQVACFPTPVVAEHGGVDVVVNNAGVALGGTFDQVSETDFEWLFAINFWGVVRMTRAFLPHLRKSDDARLVNLSSLFGLISPPGQTAYSASKFAVRGFSQSLRHELERSTIGVTVVHPGGVATAIARSARLPKEMPAEEARRRREAADRMLRLPPEKAGEIIVEGIEHRKARILVGTDAKILSLVERLAPVSYWKILERFNPFT